MIEILLLYKYVPGGCFLGIFFFGVLSGCLSFSIHYSLLLCFSSWMELSFVLKEIIPPGAPVGGGTMTIDNISWPRCTTIILYENKMRRFFFFDDFLVKETIVSEAIVLDEKCHSSFDRSTRCL